jgi:hypothetical protein
VSPRNTCRNPLREPVPALVQQLANDHRIKLAYFYRRVHSGPFYYIDESREYVIAYRYEDLCYWKYEVTNAGLALGLQRREAIHFTPQQRSRDFPIEVAADTQQIEWSLHGREIGGTHSVDRR